MSKFNQRTERYLDTVEVRIAGIPALVGVITCDIVQGSYSSNAASDLDYLGYEELEYDILDRRGYPAKWLEHKLTEDDSAEIERAIVRNFA